MYIILILTWPLLVSGTSVCVCCPRLLFWILAFIWEFMIFYGLIFRFTNGCYLLHPTEEYWWIKVWFWALSSEDETNSSTLKHKPAGIILCHNSKVHNDTFTHYKVRQIWQGHGSCWSCQTSATPLQSLLLHQQSSVYLSLPLCALHAATLPVSQWMSPSPPCVLH